MAKGNFTTWTLWILQSKDIKAYLPNTSKIYTYNKNVITWMWWSISACCLAPIITINRNWAKILASDDSVACHIPICDLYKMATNTVLKPASKATRDRRSCVMSPRFIYWKSYKWPTHHLEFYPCPPNLIISLGPLITCPVPSFSQLITLLLFVAALLQKLSARCTVLKQLSVSR